MSEETCVGTFHATYAVLKAEKILKRMGLSVKMIPVPRQISSNCGISIRFGCHNLARIREALGSLEEDLEGFYRLGAHGKYEEIPGLKLPDGHDT
jgi:hypothetical protein